MRQALLETYKTTVDKVRQYQSKEINWQELMDFLYTVSADFDTDELISEIFSLIEHEPQKGGILGLNEQKWSEYQSKIESVISQIENEINT